MVKRGILYRIHMYFEGKRIWKAKMSYPLTIRIASDPERVGNQEESSEDLMLLSDGDLFRALVAAKKDCEKENDENAVSMDRLVDCFKKRVANEISVKKNTVILYKEEAASALANGKTVPEVYYHHFAEDIKAFLGEKDSYDEVAAIYRRIKPCICGGTPELHDHETMGSGYYEIR